MIKRLLLLLILVQLSIAIFAEGGNSSTDATPIPGLPFSGSGNLIDNTDNNNERYRDEWWVLYTPHTITNLDIHPIYNGWDGYLFVYDSSLNLIASNDDGPDGYLDSQVILDLSPGETIYICIDEYSAISENPSYVLNVTTDNMWPPLPPGPVTNAFPQDGAIDVPVNTTISWEFGYYTDSYDLYLGTTYPPTSLVDSGNFTGIVGDVGFFETNNLLYNTTYYWRIELHNASHVDTATCDFSFTTMIYNDLITIGDGMEVNQHLPIEPYYGYSYSQSIYVQSEINLSNHQIWSVSYHFNNGGTLDNCNDITIYMGHTNMSSFDSNDSWIPYDQLTEVYDGPMPTIHADGWIEFELDDPFTYNNISNLVIAIKESEVAYASSNDDFYCTPCSENRSICYYNDSTNPDPMNPPTANDFVAYRPNIKLEMSMMPGAPFVMPGLIDFSAVSVGSVSPAELVTMQNVMAVDWEIQSVSINSSDFTLLDGNNYPVTLSPAERVYAGVQFNPTSSGHKYATLTITDNHNPEPITLPIHGYGYVPDNNDSSTDATELSLLGYDVEGYQEIIESQEDVDWYVFWSYENVELDIHTENAEGSDVDLAAQLYGPYENTGMSVGDSLLIAQSDNDWTDGVNPHIVYNINPDGMGFYYLRIAKSDNPPDSIDNTRWDTNDYTLWIYSDNTPPNPDCPSPHDLEYMITYQGVELEWDYFLSDTRNLEGYNVYRDSVLINPEPIPFKRCFDQGPFVHGQIYDYAVTAVFSAPMDESSPSDTISVAYVMVDPPEIAENFENYDDFSTSIPYWTMFDLDGEDTSGFVNGLDFPGEHSPMSYIVFNPNSTVPPLLEATAYSGESTWHALVPKMV